MDKKILLDYIDAKKLEKETEQDLRKLRSKRKTIVSEKVRGSMPEFPYVEQHFHVQGAVFSYEDDLQMRHEEKLLEERKANAERIRRQAEKFLNGAPARIQRIYRFKVMQGMKWEQVAAKMGGNTTADSARKEFQRFLEKT